MDSWQNRCLQKGQADDNVLQAIDNDILPAVDKVNKRTVKLKETNAELEK